MYFFSTLDDKNDLDNIKKVRADIDRSLFAFRKEAYKDAYMLTNNLLSKNPFASSLLDRVLGFGTTEKKMKRKDIFVALLKYYRSSFKHFKLLITKVRMYKKYAKSFGFSKNSLFLVDVYCPVKKVVLDAKFQDDNYFPGLYEYLKSANVEFAVLPAFYDDTNNMVDLETALSILQNEKDLNFVYGFELLKFVDFVKIAVFALLYPLKLLMILNKKELFCDDISKIARNEALLGLREVRLYEYARMLYAHRLEQNYGVLSVLGWYESQPHQKCFYKGLSVSNITGLILYPYHNSYCFIEPLEAEKYIDVYPNRFLVSQKGALSNYEGFNTLSAPSLRSVRLFELLQKERSTTAKTILVLLPQSTCISDEIIDMVSNSKVLLDATVIIKKHPSKFDYEVICKDNWRLSNDSFYDILQGVSFVVSTESSTTVEAICYGVPVIVVGMKDRHTPCYFFKEDRGVAWEIAYDEKRFDGAIASLSSSLDSEVIMNDISKKYLDYYFTNPQDVDFEVFLADKNKKGEQ
jgi:hypothetical protein